MYILSAGGSGGHVFPALSVFQALNTEEKFLITDQRGEHYLPKDISYKCLYIRRDWHYLFDMIKALFQCMKIFKKYKPQAVMGFGGYPSFPVCIAAWLMRIPFAIHEQNATLGKANRLLSFLTKYVYTSFPITPGVCIGNPVREVLLPLYNEPYIPPKDTLHCLVLGGSQGAHDLSMIVPKVLPQHIHVHHQARSEDVEATREIYKKRGMTATVESFFTDMATEYRWAHFVICRTGASTLAELAITGRPAIFVPYFAGGQQDNAKAMEEAAPICHTQEELKERLTAFLTGDLTLMSETMRRFAKPFAARDLAHLLKNIAKKEEMG